MHSSACPAWWLSRRLCEALGLSSTAGVTKVQSHDPVPLIAVAQARL